MAKESSLQSIQRRLGQDLSALRWRAPSHIYNPLEYAWSGHREYLARYGTKRGRVLLVGMNPGPWGMVQTGVPFGNILAVRDWFRINTTLARNLPVQHPKYPIHGMKCRREEGSGRRLWGWAQKYFGAPERFFDRFFVCNYCPLLFLSQNRNLTPSSLRKDEATALTSICDEALGKVIEVLKPVVAIGIGRYAEQRLREVAGEHISIRYLLHPSPANPTANRNWSGIAEITLKPWLPPRSAG